jgi:hypothetical protein
LNQREIKRLMPMETRPDFAGGFALETGLPFRIWKATLQSHFLQ